VNVIAGHARAADSRLRRRDVLAGAAAFGAAAGLGPGAAIARGTGFLAGQTLELLSGYSPGSTSALVMQEWGRAVERLLPDTQVVMRSNAGGTSALAAAQLAAAAPDGLTLGTVNTDSLLANYTGEDVHDISEFAIVASLNAVLDVLYAATGSGIGSIEDLIAREEPTILPVRSTVSGAYFQGFLANALLGTRIQPVTGYSTGERELAFLSGESQLIIKSAPFGARYVEDGNGIAILRFSDAAAPASFGNPPALSGLPIDPEFRWAVDFFNTLSPTHIFATRKDVSAERLQALRDVFMRATADPRFVAAVAPLTEIEPASGEIVQAEVASLVSQFGDLGDRIRRALDCGMQLAETGASCNP
jgi:tripartite-type tricarboxylate transporter receptor subunit TctC